MTVYESLARLSPLQPLAAGPLEPIPFPTTTIEIFLAQYRECLVQTLGSAPSTQRQHLLFARRLIEFAFPSGALYWDRLSASQLTQFVTQQTARRNRFGKKGPASSTRVLLRYLVAQGKVRAGLDAAIPKIREWKHAVLPQHLSESETSRLLQAVNDGSVAGLRNYAILLLLARLGLRATEVLHLTLDDIDWQSGSVLIRTQKTRHERTLPLSREVGEALLAYLQAGRPVGVGHRTIFLRHTPPIRPLQDSCAISAVVYRAMKKAGVVRATGRAHLLRHTAATRMVNRGASFKDVADVLGHQSLQTTAIYAKLDLAALAAVALPWPGGAQ
ncbi:MAG TPA: tyrosine-type recombinase/integrase [Blastocatellia bacterium]|nr:tyrosine-type recombinase/integrase [Blastocatellia bacterium]